MFDVRKMQQKVREKKPKPQHQWTPVPFFLTAEKRLHISVYFWCEFSSKSNCSGSCSVKFQNNNSLSVQVKKNQRCDQVFSMDSVQLPTYDFQHYRYRQLKKNFAVLWELSTPVIITFNEELRIIKNKSFLSIHVIQCD